MSYGEELKYKKWIKSQFKGWMKRSISTWSLKVNKIGIRDVSMERTCYHKQGNITRKALPLLPLASLLQAGAPIRIG